MRKAPPSVMLGLPMRGSPPLLLLFLSGLVACLALAACSDDPPPSGGGPSTTPDAGGSTECTEAERTGADGACEPILPEGDCAVGTRAELGSASCVPVGPQSCPSGFEPHASGWGCRPILPKTACTGATRDALGSTSCVPIGDCNAAFPPAGASVFVDASFTAGQIDATHVKSIAAGIAAAGANATIAIAPGTYAENLSVTKNVTLAGKCAADVIIDAPAGDAGVSVLGGKATIRGVTVRGGSPGVSAVAIDSSIVIEDSLLEDNERAGIDVFEEAKVDAKRVVIRGTKPASASSTTNGIIADVASVVTFTDGVIAGASDAGIGMTGASTITFTRSIVRDTIPRADGVGGSGARAFERGRIELVESALVANRGVGVIVGTTKASLKMDRSSIVDTKLDERPGGGANAVSAIDAATVELNDSTLADNPSLAVIARKAGTKATIKKTAIVHTYGAGEVGTGMGVYAGDGAEVTIDDSVVFEAAYAGVGCEKPGTKLTLSRSLVSATQPGSVIVKTKDVRGGYAVMANRGGSVVVTSSTIDRAQEAGVAAGTDGSTLVLDKTLVKNTLPNVEGLFGHGVLALLGATVQVERSAVDDSASVGIAFSDSTGTVNRTYVRRNAIGIHAQQGSSLVETAEVPDPLEPGTVVVTPDSRFIENGSKVGSGEIPMPGDLPTL